MSSTEQKSMCFLYGDRELWLGIRDILSAEADVIVNSANSELAHGEGLAAQILAAAGEQVQRDSDQLIREYGQIEPGMAVYTGAGQLEFKAVIHAVGPRMGEGDEQRKIEQAVSRSLLLCEANDWQSIAFPALGTDVFSVPVETCARAFHRAITRFWDARDACSVEKIMLCLDEPQLLIFFHAFRDEAFTPEQPATGKTIEAREQPEGIIELDEMDIMDPDDEMNDWFR